MTRVDVTNKSTRITTLEDAARHVVAAYNFARSSLTDEDKEALTMMVAQAVLQSFKQGKQ